MTMVLGFKPQFKQKILDGVKQHTIREDSSKRWKVGMTIQFATGVRTKQYNCFKVGMCTHIQDIEIKWNVPNSGVSICSKNIQVFIDGKNVADDYNIIDSLAKADGFDSISAFFEWFNKDFKGRLIHWTDLEY